MFSRCIQSPVSVFLIAIVIQSFPVCVGKGTTFFRPLQATTGETLGETLGETPSHPPPVPLKSSLSNDEECPSDRNLTNLHKSNIII